MDNNVEGIDPNDYIDYEKEELKRKNMQLSSALTSSNFSQEEEQNLIQYRLETDKILERIEHFLKGDEIKIGEGGAYFTAPTKKVIAMLKEDPKSKIKYYIQELKESKKGTELMREVLVKIQNKEGDEIDVSEADSFLIMKKISQFKLKDIGYKYVSVLDEDKRPFNEYGVAELMRIMSMYVTKETFLSRYSDDRINEIMSDLGYELAKFFYCNYEKIGMDTKYKESKMNLIVLNLLHIVESCYRRALGGSEAQQLHTKAIISQTGNAGGFGGDMGSGMVKQKWHPLKPRTW